MKNFLKRLFRVKTNVDKSTGVIHFQKEKYIVFSKSGIVELSKRDEHFIKQT